MSKRKALMFIPLGLLMALLSFLSIISAKADTDNHQRFVGYYSTDNADQGLGVNLAGDYKAAIRLEPSDLKYYQGAHIVGVRFNVQSDLRNVDVFVTKVKNGVPSDDICSGNIEEAPKGWNAVNVSTDYTISENDSLMVGYKYTQRNGVRAMGFYIGGPARSFWIYGNFPVSANGHGLDWYDMGSGFGSLAVQLIVENDKFPSTGVIPQGLGTISTVAKEDTTTQVNFFNIGTAPVNSIHYSAVVDDRQISGGDVDIKPAVASSSLGSFSFVIPGSDTWGNKKISVTIDKVNGEDNGADVKSADGILAIVNHRYPRNVVLENYTTENCSNWIRVRPIWVEALSQEDSTRVFAVEHHAGAQSDWLTQPCDETLTWLFNDAGYVFAPAFSVNRKPYFKSMYAAGEKDVMLYAQQAKDITTPINTELSTSADANLEVSAHEENGEIKVEVKGACNNGYDKQGLLTVYLTENNVEAHAQWGYDNGGFYHQNVIRYANSDWGDSVQWNDSTFTASYSIPVDKSWNTTQMYVMAFLARHNLTDKFDCGIENAARARVSNLTSVRSIDNKTYAAPQYYTVSGIKLNAPASGGITIVKYPDGTTRKILRK